MNLRNSTAILLLLAGWALAAGETAEIKVDQVGYLTGAPKVALVAVRRERARANLPCGGRAMAESHCAGRFRARSDDPDSGDRVQAADFSKLTAAGSITWRCRDVGRSWEFTIGPDVYGRAWYLAMRSYYGQRCGTAVDLGSEFPGFRHEACHLEGAWHASSGKSGARASSAGWHDAGDYGRYVVNSGISTGYAAVDLGDVCACRARCETETAGDGQRHAGHAQRDPLEPGVDARDAGRAMAACGTSRPASSSPVL